MFKKSCFWTLAISMTLVGLAQSKGYLDGGLGYARLSLKGDDNDKLSGWGPAFRYWFNDISPEDGLRTFLGLHSTSYPGDTYESAVWDMWMCTPEIGIAWHQTLGDSDFFLEPSVATGAPIAMYTRRVNAPKTIPELFGEDDTAIGWMIRPGVLLGYQRGKWDSGIEISYGILDIDFTGEVRGMQRELYIGLFGRFSW